MQLAEVKSWIDSEKTIIEETLKNLVELNTYTANETGVDRGMEELSHIAHDMGFTVEVVKGRHRLVKSGHGKAKPRILLISHMDTVFPPDGDFLHYEPLEDGFVRGPGTGDIKGGLVMGLWAMQAISKIYEHHDVQMVVSANEESGSPTIRDWYLGGHVGADYAIGLEPGFPQGELTATVPLGVVYHRRGYGAIRFTVKGKACHSGVAHLGLSAVEATAQRIVRLHALGDPERNTSTNVGMVNGGISPNTVAGEVNAKVSFRYDRMADGEELKAAIEDIITSSYIRNPDLDLNDTAEFTVEAFIPPMERTEKSQIIVDIVLEEAKRLRQNVVAIKRGGGSDANFISAAGTPSICGMGAPCQGLHTTDEIIHLPMMYERIELLTRTISRLIQRGE